MSDSFWSAAILSETVWSNRRAATNVITHKAFESSGITCKGQGEETGRKNRDKESTQKHYILTKQPKQLLLFLSNTSNISLSLPTKHLST